jgi:hypothetical protein
MAEIGSLAVFSKNFQNAAGADADPDLVQFYLREEVDGTELEWSITGAGGGAVTPAGMNAIVKDSTGDFHVNFVCRKPERITGYWRGVGTIYDASPLTVFVRHSLIQIVDP